MLFYILLVLITAALYYFYRRYKRTLSGRDSFTVQMLILAMMAVFYFKVFSALFASNPTGDLMKKERSYMMYAGQFGADYLRNYPWNTAKMVKNVLIIDYPDNKRLPGAAMSSYIIKGIEKSFEGSSLKISAIEKLDESSPSGGDWPSPALFDAAIKRHPNTDFVISLVGLPRMLGNIMFWRDPKAPKLLLIRGNISRLELAFKQKAVIGAMVFIPGVNFKNAKILKDENRKDLEDAFYEQFLFITPQNINFAKEDFPELFWKKPR